MPHPANVTRLKAGMRLGLDLNLVPGSITYLLLDRFNTDRAAGAVNGTPPEPGPGGNRVVVDTNSKLSIVNGAASFATGGVGVGDPGLWYSLMTRTLGRVLLARITPNSGANGSIGIGYDTAQSGGIFDDIRFPASGVLSANIAGSGVILGQFSDGTAYEVALIERAIGYFRFIRGGIFSSWTLLFGEAIGAGDRYPGIVAMSTAAVGTCDNIRIPDRLFIPVPLASDSFNRADGPLGNTDGLGHAEQNGGGGLTWTGPTWAISGNAAVNTPTQGSDVVVNGGFDTDTVWVKGTGWTIAGGVGVATASGSGNSISEAVATLGIWYLLTWTISSFTSGALRAFIGGGSGHPDRASAATFIDTGRQATGTSVGVQTDAANTTASIDNVSAVPLVLSSLFSSLVLSTVNVIWDSVVSALTTGTQAGLVARLDSASSPANFIIAYFDGAGNIKVDECVAGVYTNKLNVVKAFTAGDTLRLDLSGSAWRCYHITAAGVATLQGSGTTAVTTGNLFGNFSTYSGNTINSCVGYGKGSNNEYGMLDQF